MDTSIILLCLLFVIIIFGIVIIFLVVYLSTTKNAPQNNGQQRYVARQNYEVYNNYNARNALARGWMLEICDAASGQVFSKRFVGQLTLGRDNGSTELFWQMYVGRDMTISREQCIIYDCGGRLVVENKSHVNVTQLNGYPVVVPYILTEKSWIGMGRRNYYVKSIQQIA